MQELRLMNREFIDSKIRTDEGMKHLVIDGEVVCSAPIAFDFDEYKEEDTLVVIQGLMKHLWKQGVYMDDLNDEVYQCDMRECGERMIELASWDKRFMDCIESYEQNMK